MALMVGNHWLEPILPSPIPRSLATAASALFESSAKFPSEWVAMPSTLSTCAAINDTHHSLAIENVYVDTALLVSACRDPATSSQDDLGVIHLRAQHQLQSHAQGAGTQAWAWFFEAKTLSLIHRALFAGAGPEDAGLACDDHLVPGQLRSQSERNVKVGRHMAPSWESVDRMLQRLSGVYSASPDSVARLLGVAAYHHRLAFVHPFDDGNGRLARLLSHLQLSRLGLNAHLWSLSRGLARRRDEYWARLRNADQPRRGDLDGRGQLTQAGLVEFMAFFLEVCQEEIQASQTVASTLSTEDDVAAVLGKYQPATFCG